MFTLHVVEIYLQTYRHDMTYSVLKLPLNPNQPTNRHVVDYITFVSLIYGKYSANIHFGDILHTFIPQKKS